MLRRHAGLIVVIALALGLRLLVWRWHAPYGLGGDEREYFDQALTLLREHRYVELRLMRPPLYTGFLAACIYLLDSLVQRLRLVQAIVGALTVVPVYLLAQRLFGARRVALGAALLVALDYTLAASATELLTETLFVFGLAMFFWLLLAATDDGPFDSAQGRRRTTNEARAQGAGRRSQDPRPKTQVPSPKSQVPGPKSQVPSPRSQTTASPGHLVTLRLRSGQALSSCHLAAALAGLNLGALALLRSVALALVPLGVLWLMLRRPTTDDRSSGDGRRETGQVPPASSLQPPAPGVLVVGRWSLALCFVLAAALVVAPWTLRNYRTYGALILVDTTGAENLWLDNNPAGSAPDDPLGREAAKRALYALGDDRAARQRLATQQGFAAIASNPGWFLAKAWGEAKKFFALQFFDDMRERRAIWVPPLEVWLRLLLGDGMWLVLLLAGTAGLWLAPTTNRRETGDGRLETGHVSPASSLQPPAPGGDPRWLLVPWALYTFLTALLFHVELRYRLPLYPVLAPYAAWTLVRIADCRLQIADWKTPQSTIYNLQSAMWLAAITCVLLIGLTLLHRPYARETWMLARKHAQLWRADRALAGGDAPAATEAAGAALGLDPESALARVALARAALAGGDQQAALAALDAAIDALPAHSHAHLLRGAILREQGDRAGARKDLVYEDASLEDLQRWSWQTFAPFASVPAAVDIGGGLDLGFVRGFYLPEQGGFRWSGAESAVWLAALQSGGARLDLELNAGRPAGVPRPQVVVLVAGTEIGRAAPERDWRTYSFAIPPELIAADRRIVATIRSDTFRPRDLDRASPDDRRLGVMVRRAAMVSP